MQSNSYLIGNISVITLSVMREGSLIDPVTLTLNIKKPDGTTDNFSYGIGQEVIRNSIGNYEYSLFLAQPGLYRYKWHSSNLSAGAVEGSIVSLPSIL